MPPARTLSPIKVYMSSSSGKSAKNSLTAERLREILNYDPTTGVFTWLAAISRRAKVGAVAGCVGSEGYLLIRIDGRRYRSHRLAWLYVYGCWPSDQLDHINGIRSDNRISNLREATNAENMQNIALSPRNKSGYLGVCWNRARGKWAAHIRANGKQHHLGLFSSPAEAHAAYLAEKANLHTFNPTVRSQE